MGLYKFIAKNSKESMMLLYDGGVHGRLYAFLPGCGNIEFWCVNLKTEMDTATHAYFIDALHEFSNSYVPKRNNH